MMSISGKKIETDKFEARLQALDFALEKSNSSVEERRVLILVDLQGMYLALHEWLSGWGFPLKDGYIISRFAYFQIRRTFVEIARRMCRLDNEFDGYLQDFFDAIKVEEKDGKYFISDGVKARRNARYLSIIPRFEIFYAPVPLKEMAWHLKKDARAGHGSAVTSLRKIEAGVVARPGQFERDYSIYDDFVRNLKKIDELSGAHPGFFNYAINRGSLKYFDEKAVDANIVIRAMDTLHGADNEAVCVISSDQDFLPLIRRFEEGRIPFFQADMAKFRVGDRVGRKLRDLGEQFISGGIDPDWPLEILTECVSAPDIGHRARHSPLEGELQLLCKMHDAMNDFKIEVVQGAGNSVSFKLSKPLVG